MTDQKPPTSIEEWKPPAGSIIISEEQFANLEELAKKRPNPMPWIALVAAIVIIGIVGGMFGVVYIMRPTPIVFPTSIPTQTVSFTATVTETRSPTATVTNTPNATETIVASPVWGVVFKYFERLSMADYGSAYHLLTERCKYQVCWDNFHSDYPLFIETMRRYGPITIQELRPELVYNNTGTAFVVLFFKKEMQPHSYRFFLLFDGEAWRIDQIEFVSLIK